MVSKSIGGTIATSERFSPFIGKSNISFSLEGFFRKLTDKNFVFVKIDSVYKERWSDRVSPHKQRQ